MKLEQEIADLEARLVKKTGSPIIAEAAHLIDHRLLASAAITNSNIKPERIFDDKQWAGHLDARLFTLEFANEPLTPDFILEVHRRYTYREAPGVAGCFREDNQKIRGGVMLEKLGHKVIKNVLDNPYTDLFFEDYTRVGYPTFSLGGVRQEIDRICEWYNYEIANYHNPLRLAAELDKKLICLHPCEYLINGRPKRAIVNWSLAKCGLGPTSPKNFSNDIFMSLGQWQNELANGINRYKAIAERAKINSSLAYVLELNDVQKFYQNNTSLFDDKPDILVPGKNHDLSKHRDFVRRALKLSSLSIRQLEEFSDKNNNSLLSLGSQI